MGILIVLGTRPEIIKLWPVIDDLRKTGEDFKLLHTGQHYSPGMDYVFFRQLRLPTPELNLNTGELPPLERFGQMVIGVEKAILTWKPTCVVVQGDTDSVLAGTIAGMKADVPIAHIEAGLRSYDRSMPEEGNRVLTDHASHRLYAPTSTSYTNLMKEGIPPENCLVVGNTIVDAITMWKARRFTYKATQERFRRPYILVTVHRHENTNSKKKLQTLFKSITAVGREYNMRVVFPMHPRTSSLVASWNIPVDTKVIEVISPLDYWTFLHLESQASLVLTDSGGVQEEACILNVPCVTLRDNTERPETILVGANCIGGTVPQDVVKSAGAMLKRARNWKIPIGDGKASRRIVRDLTARYHD